MSVQAAIALLNKNAHATSAAPPPTWKSNNTSSTTPGNDKAAELKRIRTRTSSGGVASILSKFDQQQPQPQPQQQLTATNSGNNNIKKGSSISKSNTSSPTPAVVVATTESALQTLPPTESSSSSLLATKPLVPTAGKAVTRRSRSASVRDRAATINRNNVADTISHELAAMHQETLNKLQAAEETINKLRQEHQHQSSRNSTPKDEKKGDDTADMKSMASQIRDYEIRIQYLSEKLDQLSQEHSTLERQLDQERRNKRITLDTPISPEFRPFSKLFDASNTTTSSATTTSTTADDDRRRITVDTNITSENDEFWNCLLDVYEKGSSVSTALTTEEEDEEDAEQEQSNTSNSKNNTANNNHNSISKAIAVAANDSKEQAAELLFVKKQLTAVEKGAQMMLERHVRDLEKERQQTRTLTEVVHKQDQLIASLEAKLCSDEYSSKKDNNSHLLLQEQVELQRIELEDKRSLLTRLLDEREELMRQVMNNNSNNNKPVVGSGMRSRSASVRSSIDVLSEMSREHRHPLSRASSSSMQPSPRSSYGSQAALGRSTPPPTAPPKDPLPPLPPRSSSSMHSILSPATSWSSADYAAATGRYSNNSKSSEIFSSTVYRETLSNTTNESSQQQQQPVWLDYPSPMDQQQQQQQQQLQPQHKQQPQSPTSSSVSRQPTIKLRKAASNSNAAFWKGWRHRLGSK